MNIGFDASILHTAQPTGVEQTFRSLLLGLEALKRNNHFILFTHPDFVDKELTEKYETIPVKGCGRFLWRERFLPKLVEQLKIDILHSPVSAFSLTARCRKICTIHEIPWQTGKIKNDEGSGFAHRAWAYLAANYANRIICVSKTTAQNFFHLYPFAAAKTHIIYHGLPRTRYVPGTYLVPRGPSSCDNPKNGANSAQNIDEKDQVHETCPSAYQVRTWYVPGTRGGDDAAGFFLMVGKGRAKKNLLQAVRCLHAFHQMTKDNHKYKLILVGPLGPATEKALRLATELNIRDQIVVTGYLSPEKLHDYYQKATALLYLSHSEGFGLPPLEAMAEGAPVIASNRGSIPEICGQAAYLVSPDNTLEIVQAMRELTNNPKNRQQCILAGKQQITKYSWHETAKRVMNLYRELLGQEQSA